MMGIDPAQIDPSEDLNEKTRWLLECLTDHVDEETALAQIATAAPLIGGMPVYLTSAESMAQAQRTRQARQMLEEGASVVEVIRATRCPARTAHQMAAEIEAEIKSEAASRIGSEIGSEPKAAAA